MNTYPRTLLDNGAFPIDTSPIKISRRLLSQTFRENTPKNIVMDLICTTFNQSNQPPLTPEIIKIKNTTSSFAIITPPQDVESHFLQSIYIGLDLAFPTQNSSKHIAYDSRRQTISALSNMIVLRYKFSFFNQQSDIIITQAKAFDQFDLLSIYNTPEPYTIGFIEQTAQIFNLLKSGTVPEKKAIQEYFLGLKNKDRKRTISVRP